ncbi:AMP-dependent synthetase/ligase [Streptomyces xiamenensis]|uniref:AMP-dependent synthetase/ligase n=1 Tax=Streptomyces xiamenensis TaxID=408015 RepID=UPI0036E6CF9A
MTPPQDPHAPPPAVIRPRLRRAHGAVVEASLPALVPAVEQGSLADIPFVNAQQAPDAVAFSRQHRDGTWYDVTCAEFAGEVLAVAKGLIAHGLAPGDRLAIMSRTRYEWTLLDFAAWAAGLITVPVHPTATARQVSWILRDAGARACAVEGVEEARTLTAIRAELPHLEHLWQLTAIHGSESSAIGQISAAGRALPHSAVGERRRLLTPGHIATLTHTSGTAALPQGCVLTHAHLFTRIDNAIELLYPIHRSLTDRPAGTLLTLPLAHALGRTVALSCVRARIRLGHAPGDALPDLAGFRPTFLVATPQLLERVHHATRTAADEAGRGAAFDRGAALARRIGAAVRAEQHGTGDGPGLSLRAGRSLYEPTVYRRVREALGGEVRFVISGGAPLSDSLATFYEGAGIPVHEAYGLTETAATAVLAPPHAPRLGTVGWPLPGTAVRIADDGEILLRGGQICSGYWDSRTRSIRPVTGNGGWLPTGDLGTLDDDGYLTVDGRKQDLITTADGGRFVPGPLERAVGADPLIGHCVVVGDRRPYLTALLTLDPEGLAQWLRAAGRRPAAAERMAEDPELLRHIQRVVEDAGRIQRFRLLPRPFTVASGYLTPAGTLRRAAVVRDHAREIEALYERRQR